MAKYLSAIRARVRQMLRDEFEAGESLDFKDDELDIHIRDCLPEISNESPHMSKEVLTTIGNSKVLDISSIENLLWIDKLEYPTGNDPRDFRNFNELDGETVEMRVGSAPSESGGSGTLTGTVTFTKGSATVTGSGTAFTTELAAGYHIKKSSGSRWYRIYSIESALSLTLAEPCLDNGADTVDVTQYCHGIAYAYCAKSHELTESVSTLNPQLAKLVVDGAVAKASLSWVNEMRGQIAAAISTATSAATAIGNMSARVTQAISDLTSGRALIATKHTESDTAIGNMSARVTQAIDDLTTGRALIGSKKTEAITALDAVADLITQAADDLTTGRAQIDDARTLADTAIDNMSARITQAIDDLTSGRALINTVPIGTSPETDYSNYAGRELGIAVDYLNQAKGYLGEGATSDRYQAYAARDLQAAATYISQARGYLAIDTVTAEYGNFAARELNSANTYLSQARAFLAQDAKSTPYANYAAREVNNATTYLNQAGGYLRQLTSQLNIAKTISGYQTWGNNKLALYRDDLKKITKTRVYREYSQ